MNYSICSGKGYITAVETVNIHVTSYDISRERGYKYQSMYTGQDIMGDAFLRPVRLILRGRILREECKNAEERFCTDMDENRRYPLKVDRMFFSAARLESFNTHTEMDAPYIDCELKFVCDNYIEEVKSDRGD